MNMEKTNVMRLLDAANVSYESKCYLESGAISGKDVAAVLGEDENQTFKTLVTVGKTKQNYVFVIPVSSELDLKKAASAVNEKSIEMIKSKELLPLTGYIHGGCSPIGMKKQFVTVIDETAILFDEIMFSAGKIGYQVKVKVEDLERMFDYSLADVCKQ